MRRRFVFTVFNYKTGVHLKTHVIFAHSFYKAEVKMMHEFYKNYDGHKTYDFYGYVQ